MKIVKLYLPNGLYFGICAEDSAKEFVKQNPGARYE